jgi:hypothetical protein
MSWRWAALTALLVLGGCKSLTKKHDNPVMQPPPRRVSLDDSEVESRLAARDQEKETKTASSDVALTAANDADADDPEVFNAKVIARVNGAPVFAGEILDRYGGYLAQARQKLPPEQYVQLRDTIIRRDLRSHIERRLLVERMRTSLKPDQLKQLEGHLDKMFEPEIAKLKHELNVSTRTELELALNERNTTLDTVRDAFATNRLAMEYLAAKIEKPPAPTRPELVAYYQEHLADYAIPAQVKWQQIQVSFNKRTGKAPSRERIQGAKQRLQRGEAFTQVAKELSDGATASDGGVWDWTKAGSLADNGLEKLLFAQPVGQVSDIYEGRDAFHLVQVLDRQTEGRKPFIEVQDEIQQKITEQRQKDLPKQFVDKLFAEAIIETDYPLAAE